MISSGLDIGGFNHPHQAKILLVAGVSCCAAAALIFIWPWVSKNLRKLVLAIPWVREELRAASETAKQVNGEELPRLPLLTEAVSGVAPSPPLASPEALQQLRTFHGAWRNALCQLHSFILNDVCEGLTTDSFPKIILAYVVSRRSLIGFSEESQELSLAIPRHAAGLTEERLGDLCSDVAEWVKKWNDPLVHLAEDVGTAVKGASLFNTNKYEVCCELQAKALEARERFKDRTDALVLLYERLDYLKRLTPSFEIALRAAQLKCD